MSRGMVAFLAGLGGGYLKAQDKAKEDERRAKDDAWQEEQRGRMRQEWKAKDALDADLRTAGQPATVEEGAGGMVKPDTMDNRDVGLAENQALPNGGLMQGQFKVGSKSYADKSEADKAVADHNAPQAVATRTADTLRKHGKVTEAMSMENAVIDQQAKKLGLDVAQAKWADEQFNRRITEQLSATPNWHDGAAKLLTDTQVGGMGGVNVTPKLSADGKTVEFVAQRGEQTKVLGQFSADANGMTKFMQQVARVPLESKIGWVVEGEKAKREEERWQQTFDFNKKKEENDQQYRQRVLGLQYAQERRLSEVHKTTMDDAKIPPGVKLQAQTLAKQMETNNAALSKAMAEGLFDPNSAGTKRLIEQQAVLTDQYRELMTPYTPGAKGPSADPLQMRQPAASAAAQSPGQASQQPAAPQSSGQPQQTTAATAPAAQASARPTTTMASVTAKKAPSLVEAIAGPGADPALTAIAQQKATAVSALAQQLKQAQAEVVTAAKSGGNIAAAQQKIAAARAEVTKLLAGMNEQQAAQVLSAAGI